MRTMLTALIAALLLTFGVATAVAAQEDAEATAEGPTAVSTDDVDTAAAGDAVAIDDDCDEAATAGAAVAVDDDDECEEAPAPQAPETPRTTTTTTTTNLPRTGAGATVAGQGSLLVALLGVAAVTMAAAAYRLRRS